MASSKKLNMPPDEVVQEVKNKVNFLRINNLIKKFSWKVILFGKVRKLIVQCIYGNCVLIHDIHI